MLCAMHSPRDPLSSIFDLHCSVLSTRYSALFDLSGLGSAKARNRSWFEHLTMSLSTVDGSGGEAAVIEGTDVAGTQAKQVKTELDTRPTGIGGAIHCHA